MLVGSRGADLMDGGSTGDSLHGGLLDYRLLSGDRI